MNSNCQQIVRINPKSIENVGRVMSIYLEQYGPGNLIIGTFLLTSLLSTFYPNVPRRISALYGFLLLSSALYSILDYYYYNNNPFSKSYDASQNPFL
jgi:hypothetical protein